MDGWTGWKNVVERFVWTAVQAFAGALPATIAFTSVSEWKAAGVAGLTAAIAAVISLGKNLTAEGIRTAQSASVGHTP